MQRLSYEEFWKQLIPAYPVSKGKMRLPIVSEPLTIDGIDMPAVLDELQNLLTELLHKRGTREDARARAIEADESRITELIDDDVTGVVRFDCGIDTNGRVKVFEINCDYPDGLLLHDHSYSVLEGNPTSLHRAQLEALFGEEDIAVVHDREAMFLDAYYFEKEQLLASGKRVTIGGPEHQAPGTAVRRCLEVSKLSGADCINLKKLVVDL